jgi:hypothetical protein
MKFCRAAVALVLPVALWVATARAGEAPPKIYIDKGACPFECCTYREWTVTADTVLFDRPDKTKPVDQVLKGKSVKAVTGEVHVFPTPFKVVFAQGRFHVGDTAYLLTYEGEGFYKVWFRGGISEEEVHFTSAHACVHPSEECWGRIEKEYVSDWWILIKTPRGKQGWTNQADHFGNKDACSG